MVEEGADILDVGAESTRPGHEPVPAAEETARAIPVIAAIHAALPRIPISVDTTKVEVAAAALAAGAVLLNDSGRGARRHHGPPRRGAAGPAHRHAHRAVAQYADFVAELLPTCEPPSIGRRKPASRAET